MNMGVEVVKKYFSGLSELQISQFEQLGALYPEWNEKINVISRKDIENLYVNHILHSLGIAKFIDFKNGSKVLDMGTGGGFPGIPLAILFPEVKFHLVDRIGKKIKVAQDIADKIGLKNVTTQHGDVKEVKGTFDFVVSRAVMNLDDLVNVVRRSVSRTCINAYPNGLVCLKGGDLQAEVKKYNNLAMISDLSDYFAEPFFETKKVVYVQLI
jgi:16S rRNA (guanine527-N7)-methyltransferase